MITLQDTVEMIASGYEWVCPECGEDNTETGIPVIGTALADIRCQECGTLFNCGGADHHYNRM